MTVDSNSCGYLFKVEGSSPPYGGNAKIDCALEGDSIDYALNWGPLGTVCTVSVLQQPLDSVEYSTVGSGSARKVSASVKGEDLYYIVQGGPYSGLCAEKGVNEDGLFSGSFLLEGLK